MKKGDNLGFALEVGKYPVEPGKPAKLIISNAQGESPVISEAVASIKVER